MCAGFVPLLGVATGKAWRKGVSASPLLSPTLYLRGFTRNFLPPAQPCGAQVFSHNATSVRGAVCRQPLLPSCVTSMQQLHQLHTKNILKMFHLCCTAEYRMSQNTLAVASLRVDCCAAVREPLFFGSQLHLHSGITYTSLQHPVHWGNIT